ncbi:unnamed protein product [Lepidochelys kempii]
MSFTESQDQMVPGPCSAMEMLVIVLLLRATGTSCPHLLPTWVPCPLSSWCSLPHLPMPLPLPPWSLRHRSPCPSMALSSSRRPRRGDAGLESPLRGPLPALAGCPLCPPGLQLRGGP